MKLEIKPQTPGLWMNHQLCTTEAPKSGDGGTTTRTVRTDAQAS